MVPKQPKGSPPGEGGDPIARASEAAAALTEFFANNIDVIKRDPLLSQVVWSVDERFESGAVGGILPGQWKQGGGAYISVAARSRAVLGDLLDALLALVGGDYSSDAHKKYADLHKQDPHLRKCEQFADLQIVLRSVDRVP